MTAAVPSWKCNKANIHGVELGIFFFMWHIHQPLSHQTNFASCNTACSISSFSKSTILKNSLKYLSDQNVNHSLMIEYTIYLKSGTKKAKEYYLIID